ncbi:hypothetical protein BXZ70DRAFT_890805 [Cristinia sonorae]|uniref:MYND-type domain-containing protein n=1 Tax=Cristinia sonorae TaxID=1940300 RepID=A0A8K0XR01_9AGAR|nr:hypothetical protein BXZ70DRAFT_890805 [Cristinia sonorae]
MYCQQVIESPRKPLRCSACKAVLYCSKECAKRGWNHATVNAQPGTPTHKELCADNARHMKRLPETQAITKQFPWGRLETDGSFNRDIARGRFGVLGSDDVGFWSHKGGPVPHQNNGPFKPAPSGYMASFSRMIEGFDHLDGKDLLKTRHLSDQDGWKLPSRLIPYRDFPSDDKRPIIVTEFGEPVKDWDSWYRWRKIPKESPAALIMDFPMSVYQMVVNCLEITNATIGSEEKRIQIHIQMLGVEVELNYLPLFSELALLLPYHDIKLVMFGYSVHKLWQESRKHPKSLVAKSSPTTPIFTYKAPVECGSGSIEVFLQGESPTWSPTDSPFGRPDALVACNAGLGSYPDWVPVIIAAHVLEIPFATTEYAEQSAETQRSSFPIMVMGRAAPRKEYPIELNPFQSPGQRGLPMIRLPNTINGFTLVVVKNEEKKVNVLGKAPEKSLEEKFAEFELD